MKEISWRIVLKQLDYWLSIVDLVFGLVNYHLSNLELIIWLLKEQCHEDFAVLGQFFAKIIIWGFDHKQNTSVKLRQRRISNEFYQRGLTIIFFLRIFGARSIKTWKNGPIFSCFNPFPSMPSEATGDRKQFQYLQIVFSNKTRSLFLVFIWCEDTF